MKKNKLLAIILSLIMVATPIASTVTVYAASSTTSSSPKMTQEEAENLVNKFYAEKDKAKRLKILENAIKAKAGYVKDKNASEELIATLSDAISMLRDSYKKDYEFTIKSSTVDVKKSSEKTLKNKKGSLESLLKKIKAEGHLTFAKEEDKTKMVNSVNKLLTSYKNKLKEFEAAKAAAEKKAKEKFIADIKKNEPALLKKYNSVKNKYESKSFSGYDIPSYRHGFSKKTKHYYKKGNRSKMISVEYVTIDKKIYLYGFLERDVDDPMFN